MTSTTHGAFRALSDDTRRQILTLLRNGAQTSGQIAEHFSSSWPTISRHLAILRAAGLVAMHRRGQEVYYELDTSVLEDLLQQVMTWTQSARVTRRRRSRGPVTQEG